MPWTGPKTSRGARRGKRTWVDSAENDDITIPSDYQNRIIKRGRDYAESKGAEYEARIEADGTILVRQGYERGPVRGPGGYMYNEFSRKMPEYLKEALETGNPIDIFPQEPNDARKRFEKAKPIFGARVEPTRFIGRPIGEIDAMISQYRAEIQGVSKTLFKNEIKKAAATTEKEKRIAQQQITRANNLIEQKKQLVKELNIARERATRTKDKPLF